MCMIIMIHMNGYGKASEMIDAFSFKYFLSKGIIFFTAWFGEYLCHDQWFCERK